jgi:hypothetical protein
MKMKNLEYDPSDIKSFEDVEFYREQKLHDTTFLTISDFIATFQDHEQSVFNVLAFHNIDATPLDIEKSILRNALSTVGDNPEDEMGSVHDLVKLSSCTHWMEKYRPEDAEKIKTFTARQDAKWYFQPDQRCVVVQQFIDEDPDIASQVISLEDWLISRGEQDPSQNRFNRILIDCFNSERMGAFKEQYGNLINSTFDDEKVA